MPDEKIDQKRPAHADNELHKMQQRLVDDTVDDSFPASDPPAWTTTGAKSVAAKLERDEASDRTESGGDGDGTGTGRRAMDEASRLAREAYRRSADYVERGREYLPRAGEAARVVARPVEQYPLMALLVAGAVGYGLAWLIHGRSARDTSHGWDDHDEGGIHDASYQDPYTYRGETYPPSGDSPKPHGDKLRNVVKVRPDERDRY